VAYFFWATLYTENVQTSMQSKNHIITSELHVTKSSEKNPGIPHILSRQHHRASTDHILNVNRCTYCFSDMPRSLAHYFQTDSVYGSPLITSMMKLLYFNKHAAPCILFIIVRIIINVIINNYY